MRRLSIITGLLAWLVAGCSAFAQGIAPLPVQVGGQYTGGCAASRPLPLDATTITWTAAHDVCALTTNWLNGKPLFDIVVGGNTYTIKSVNGFPDVRRLAALLGVSPVFGTAGAPISKWYDQSGNGNDSVQATSANRPAIWLINGRVSVAFDGFLVDFGSAANADKFFNFASITTNNQNTTVYAAVQQVSGGATFGYSTSDFPSLFTTGTAGATGFTVSGGPPVANGVINWHAFSWVSFTNTTTTLWPETQPAVVGVIASSTNFTVTQNEESASSGSALAAGTASGGYLGAANFFSINGGLYGRMYGFMIAGGATAIGGQQQTIRNALYALHGIAKATPKYALLIDGASIDVATGGLIAGINGYGWVEQMLAQLPYPIRMGNTSVYGATIANINGTVSASQCSFFQAGVTNVLIGPGTAAGNSITGGKTGAQTFTDLQTYLTSIKACTNAPTIIFVTLLGTSCAECVNYNNLVIANAATLGITVLSQGYFNTIVAAFSPTSNAQYFNQSPSWLTNHFTAVGYQNFSRSPLAAIQQAIGP